MKIKINRFKNIYDGTIGKLTIMDDGKRLFECFTLEPAGPDTTERDKDRRIPVRRYQMQWHNSPSQKRMCPLLWNLMEIVTVERVKELELEASRDKNRPREDAANKN